MRLHFFNSAVIANSKMGYSDYRLGILSICVGYYSPALITSCLFSSREMNLYLFIFPFWWLLGTSTFPFSY